MAVLEDRDLGGTCTVRTCRRGQAHYARRLTTPRSPHTDPFRAGARCESPDGRKTGLSPAAARSAIENPIQVFNRLHGATFEIEPDLVPAYQNLGAALYSAGQPDNAIEIYRRGLDVNPLSAVLYYNMGVIQRDRGEVAKARAAIAVARTIDPEFVSRQEGVH